MKRQSQFLVFAKFFAQHSTCLLTVVLFVTLVLVKLAEALPPPPDTSDNFEKERSSSSSFTPREVDFQAPSAQPAPQKLPAATPSRSKSESYLVYVNPDSSLRLQQVQQVEPTAFVRQYRGRSAIQAGVFNQISNAQNLANILESKGIDARIVSLTTGEDTDFVSNHQFYFVVIPAKRDKLGAIADQVKQLKMDLPINISQEELPRTHVRVGPFLEQKQAENWKRYLKASGLKKARVYYGR